MAAAEVSMHSRAAAAVEEDLGVETMMVEEEGIIVEWCRWQCWRPA
jgi:hypothetical protein